MKRIVVALVIVISVSCSSNDNNPPPITLGGNSLVGTWNVTKIVYVNSFTGTVEPDDVEGTITFNSNDTGRENYRYTISGTTIPNISNFTWRSTNTQIVFDEGTDDEAVWVRLENTNTKQIGRYDESSGNTTITITIEK